MPKVSIMTPEKAHPVAPPTGYSGLAEAVAYFEGEKSPLHLHLHEIAPGETLRIGQSGTDRLAYVWRGGVDAGGCRLAKGSSMIVEHGQALDLKGHMELSAVLSFSAARAPAAPREGGHVHLLPVERVPRVASVGGASGVGGAMHADSSCPTCELWLHENFFPGAPPLSLAEQQRGVHSHTEDEIIFVIDGQIRLGTKLYGSGTALAIAADTLYSFTAGPDGLSFVNFRAGTPGDIKFANGACMSETAFWRERVAQPVYLAPH
jgi:hypothetical protein